MAKRSKKRCEQLPILHPHAAGIDIGASELFVAVSADRDPQPVRSFPTFTRDLNALADQAIAIFVCFDNCCSAITAPADELGRTARWIYLDHVEQCPALFLQVAVSLKVSFSTIAASPLPPAAFPPHIAQGLSLIHI